MPPTATGSSDRVTARWSGSPEKDHGYVWANAPQESHCPASSTPDPVAPLSPPADAASASSGVAPSAPAEAQRYTIGCQLSADPAAGEAASCGEAHAYTLVVVEAGVGRRRIVRPVSFTANCGEKMREEMEEEKE